MLESERVLGHTIVKHHLTALLLLGRWRLALRRTRRHNGVRNRYGLFADAAHMRPELEKPGLLQPCPEQPDADRRRPADCYVPSWQNGTPAAFDFAITSPHRDDIRLEASRKSGAAAEAYEVVKRQYLGTAADCQRQGFAFIPIVGEPTGGWGPSALCAFKALERAIVAFSGGTPGDWSRKHRQALCVLLRQANARAIFRRDPGSIALSYAPGVAARLALETA